MIKVFVSEEKIELHGHSGYDIVGKDIVCSAVSSIVTTTINGILSINSDALKYSYKNDIMTIEILNRDNITDKLINNMIDLLNSLSRDYPKNIIVKEM
jgi:hypothetical protein